MDKIAYKNLALAIKRPGAPAVDIIVWDIVMTFNNKTGESVFDIDAWNDLVEGFNGTIFVQNDDPEFNNIKSNIYDNGYFDCILVGNINTIGRDFADLFAKEFSESINVDAVYLI